MTEYKIDFIEEGTESEFMLANKPLLPKALSYEEQEDLLVSIYKYAQELQLTIDDLHVENEGLRDENIRLGDKVTKLEGELEAFKPSAPKKTMDIFNQNKEY
jgi:predicted RNase H-like nuclease (RuvC/YqgF family)